MFGDQDPTRRAKSVLPPEKCYRHAITVSLWRVPLRDVFNVPVDFLVAKGRRQMMPLEESSRSDKHNEADGSNSKSIQ